MKQTEVDLVGRENSLKGLGCKKPTSLSAQVFTRVSSHESTARCGSLLRRMGSALAYYLALADATVT